MILIFDGNQHFISCLPVFITSSSFPSMSKHPIPSNDAPPTKCSRKLAGFQLAWQFPPTSDTPGLSSSCKTSLFITVNQPDERCVILRTETRLLSGTAQSSSTSESPESYMQTSSNSQLHDARAEIDYTESQQEVKGPEQNTKPKRKRNTNNLVSIFSNCEV